MKGLCHIYTGDGKGKTTAAVGLAVRAAGSGLKVFFVQFLKGRPTGEIRPLELLGIETVRSEGVVKFIPEMTPEEKAACVKAQQGCWEAAREAAGSCDLLILDEVIAAATMGMITIGELCEFIINRPEGLELVLTGRDAPPELLELADYITEMHAVRHPFENGADARRGIEY